MSSQDLGLAAIEEFFLVGDGDPQILLVLEHLKDLLQSLGFKDRHSSEWRRGVAGSLRRKGDCGGVVDVELQYNSMRRCDWGVG